jgi:hypothetical protein
MATKVKVGSPCILEYIGKRYRGVIQEIRASTKMFKVEFTYATGRRKSIWRNAHELAPLPGQEDVEPMQVHVLSPPPEAHDATSDGQASQG